MTASGIKIGHLAKFIILIVDKLGILFCMEITSEPITILNII